MERIINNPFRVLGLPVTATERQISKRVSDLSMFCEMGKRKQYDTDFLFISPLERTLNSIQQAASQIEIPAQKMFHSTFWFWPGNSIDELVFELLKENHILKARELWAKSVSPGELTGKNFSNSRNLALLNMIISTKINNIDKGGFIDSVSQLVRTFQHERFLELSRSIAGSNCRVSIEDIEKYLSDEAYKVVAVKGNTEHAGIERKIINAFNEASKSTLQYICNKFSGEPIRQIESAIQQCQETKLQGTSDIYTAAKSLYLVSKDRLKHLKGILTSQDIHYQYIADKVANELLQCSTDYFIAMIEVDDSFTPYSQAKTISTWARELAVGQSVKVKVEEDLRLISDLRIKKKKNDIGEEILELLERLPKPDKLYENNLATLPQTLRTILDKSKYLLGTIKGLGGDNNEDYLFLNNYLAGAILRLSIEYANKSDNYRPVVSLLNDIKNLKMEPDLRSHYLRNFEILKNNLVMQEQVEKAQKELSNSNSGGCYIATLVYGSYEAPEVLVLRRFRDEILAKSFAGSLFVRVYYAISPHLAVLLKEQAIIQGIIRNYLDMLIRKLES